MFFIVVANHVIHILFFTLAEFTLYDSHEFLLFLHALILQEFLVGLFFVLVIHKVWSVVNKLLQISIEIFTFIFSFLLCIIDVFATIIIRLIIAAQFGLFIHKLVYHFQRLFFLLFFLEYLLG
jgi:hypothetical protein